MLPKIPFFWSYYLFGWPRVLPANYTFSLTYRCNSRCRTCNVWQKKQGKELSLEEWSEIFSDLGTSPYWVTLSGGEPFLRKDLTEIVKNLYQTCQPKIITMPTNGLLTKRIAAEIKEIVRSCPKTRFVINLSLDGIGEKHDEIRGIKGNFKAVMATFELLKAIRTKANNLTIGVHTVISNENVKDFPEIANFVFNRLKPDSYVTEIAENRAELDNLNSNITPTLKDYKKAISFLKMKMKKQKQTVFPRITRAFRLVYYNLVQKVMEKQKQVIPCFAGIASAQIAPNGDVWPCCVRADVLGNLKKENFNFAEIWFSKKAGKVRESIKARECYCPLANVSYTNILMNPRSLGQVIFEFLHL